MVFELVYAILLFALTYVLMLVFSKYRPQIAIGSAVIFIVTGMLPLNQIVEAIDFNVLMMIAGTMGLVKLFIDSKMPALLADLIMEKVPNVQMAAVALALFAGVISAFVDNVATVLMVAPIALEICKKLKTNPVPFIIAIAVSSNLQGAATLVGDTTAIMLGSYANMSFLDFIIYHGKPGIFFAVELGAVVSALILAWLFRGMESRLGWAILSGAYGLSFGALCALVYLPIGGPAMFVATWVAGIPFDLLHCAGNFAMALLLFQPCRRVLTALWQRMGDQQ